ncbi:type IV pili methyl-accepting chemotaxis transducer N-terminal domain-containing protein [Ramlibacter monticola]|uniref:Type IV pili methyl-accepting chemotaxis transducer N-terminal domain-containing protein n=1 Tax=Ramlibacter monticola TaxID=1926872 RepID=A0A937CQQ5_9BURK|nr:type IV pili methyl-accepting chemotaxis transducer N-terminal domain-containing protein [Ramlibacter monticola]
MTTVLLLKTPDPGAPALVADFTAAGFEVRGEGDCAHLVRETLRAAPDVLVCWAPRPTSELLQSVATLQAQQPVPVLWFTQDGGVEWMQRALEAGVHAWVVQGYGPARLRPLVHLALAREAHERALRSRAAELADKLEERKWIDKAKGVLMRAQQVGEEEAFQLLRNASMQGNQRVGQVSRQVIEAARIAQAINRAGQQRMLSQRLVKLYALACSRTEGAAAGALMRESIQRVEDNLASLQSDLSAASYGDLLAAAREGWQALRQSLEAPPRATELARLDRQADTVVAQANALVLALESSGAATTVQAINVAGALRWRSQRMAKLALMQGTGGDKAALAAAMEQTAAEFEEGLAALQQAPLSTPLIRSMLEHGESAWKELRAAVPGADRAAGRMKLAAASEELFELFDQLTEAYQHSIQVLMGG